MNEKTEELRELKEALDGVLKEHRDAISREPGIGGPLSQAASEANRRYKCITEGHAPKEGSHVLQHWSTSADSVHVIACGSADNYSWPTVR